MNAEQELPTTTIDKATRLRRIIQSHEKLQVVSIEDELDREREEESE